MQPLYQIYYDDSQLSILDSSTIHWNNNFGKNPELREYPIFKKIYEDAVTKNFDAWGTVSHRFKHKTHIDCKVFSAWIGNNPGYDVYFVNPCIVLDSLFDSVWSQGELHHPGIIDLGTNLLRDSGYNIDLHKLKINSNSFAFCNYFYATKEFWNKYFDFVDKVISAADADPELINDLYNSKANYSRDRNVSYYPFLIERLFSTFLCINSDIKKLHFEFNLQDLSNKLTAEEYGAVEYLLRLKNQAISDQGQIVDQKIYQHWQHEKATISNQHQGLFYKE